MTQYSYKSSLSENTITSRPLPIAVYRRFKEGFGDLVRHSGGVESAARVTRVGTSALYQMQSVNEIGHFPPVDVIADLEQKSGVPVLTKMLAEIGGYSLIPVRPFSARGSFSVALAHLGKEVSEIFSEAAIALDDGCLTAREAKVLIREIDSALLILEEMRHRLRDISESGASVFYDLAKEQGRAC